MRTNRLLFALALPLMLLAGCAKDGGRLDTPGGEIDFTIAFAGMTDPTDPQTRVSVDEVFVNAWEDGDRIGLFAVAAGIVNVPLTYDANANMWNLDDGTKLYWPQGVASLDFSAYYPYDEEYTDPDDVQVFRVAVDQTGEGFESSVVMTASANRVSKGATVSLTFKHAAALVQFTMNDTGGIFDPTTPMTVTLLGVDSTPLTTAPAPADNIAMYRLATTDPATMVFRALVAPQTLTAGTRMFHIEQGAVALQSSALTGVVALTGGRVTKFTQSSSLLAPVKFTDGSIDVIAVSRLSEGLCEIAFGGNGSKVVYSVGSVNGKEHLIGRRDDETVTLKIDPVTGDLQLRNADADGNIPIGTYAEMALIDTNFSFLERYKYLQEADLDLLGDESLTALGLTRQNWTPIASSDGHFYFEDSYDGGGHTIANLYVDRSDNSGGGLFWSIGEQGSLSNIGIISGSVTGSFYVGGLCGQNFGTITACYNKATVSGRFDSTGGVCGQNNGTITDCYNTGSVMGDNSLGGVCGENNADIIDCYNTGAVSGSIYVGGVCGLNYNGGITGCNNTGNVSGERGIGGVCGQNSNYATAIIGCQNSGAVSGGNDAGGVCSTNYSVITNCHNTGTVSANDNANGVCYENWDNGIITACSNTGVVSTNNVSTSGVCGLNNGTIIACYNTGAVSSANGNVSGVCLTNFGTVTACYNTGEVSGTMAINGLCGQNLGDITACYNTGKVSGEMDVNSLCWTNFGTITACYFLQYDGQQGVGDSEFGTAQATPFGDGMNGTDWPTDTEEGWGVDGVGNGSGGHWKNLGIWNSGGTPSGAASTFPRLWWEED